ncbi:MULTISPECIES: SdrD B-like domain-containing protein [unclassified Microbacterium]|uniref:SdrD B-like domain-containing protein n=1 Tax=unclassified Microbacterium TaxID=2609290 RepID=UPI0011B01614|nr:MULTISPECIES: SdrD B-like domain-containing protein [unclassified Microbacterium]
MSRTKSPTKSRFALAITAALALILGLLNPAAAFAGNDGMLSTALTAKNTSVYAGDALVYEAQLSCSDPAECTDVSLHFTKPDAVKPGAKGVVTKPYPPGVTSVTANDDGTIDVVYSATAAGLVSQLTVSWPTENLSTPPGDQTTTMTVTQPGVPNVVRDATIALLADSDLAIDKRGAATTQPDQNYTYTIDVGLTYPDPGNGNHGGLSYTDAVVVDPLPAEAVYVSASNSGVYNPTTHTVTWKLGDLRSGVNNISVTVRYPAPADGTAPTYVNTATLTATQIGSKDPTSVSDDSPVTVRADTPTYRTESGKTGTPLIAGGSQHFDILATNHGNTDADITINDPIPDGLIVSSVDGGYYRGNIKAGSTVEFHYADGTSSGPLDFTVNDSKIDVPDGAPRVTSVTFVFRKVEVEKSIVAVIHTAGDWDVIGDKTSITNCATVETTGAGDAQQRCATIEVSPVDVPSPAVGKSAEQAAVGPGGTMTWTVAIGNSDANPTALMPVLYDSIPNQVTFVPGSFRAVSGNGSYCLADDDFQEEVLPDWNTTHGTPFTTGARTTVRWTYTGTTGLVVPKWQAPCHYEYDTVVNPGVASGVYGGYALDAAYQGNLIQIFDRDLRIPASPYGWNNDIFDGDGDGDTTEQAPRKGADFAIADTAAAWIEKKVTGDQDNGHWFDSAEKKGMKDEVGTSTPGGTVSYQVRLGNLGNRDLKNLVAYDLLPVPGNPGVTNGRYAQNPPGAGNQWTPTMTGPIANPTPDSLTITYSIKTDPCRPEMDNSDEHSASFYCNGQQDASWQSAEQVTDWSQIHSVRFDFGDKVFTGGEFVDLEWTMATPTTLADGSPILGRERTWNRIAMDSVQAADGSPMLAAEAPWVVDQMATPTEPAISIEKWSTSDGFPAGDFDTAPGKAVKANTPTAITMTIANTGAEALRDVKVTDDTLDGPALTDLDCDFSSLGGPKTGTTWAGPLAVGDSFDCTGTVPGLASDTTHGDDATVTGTGVVTGTVVTDEDPWFATSETLYSIGDYTWIDANGNGVQDKGEVPISGVLVILHSADGTEIARTTTDAHGYYHFDRLPAGDYSLEFGEVPGYQRTPSMQGSDTTVDSDADVTTGRTALIHLDEGAENVTPSEDSDGVTAPFINRTIDAGYISLVPTIDIEKWSTKDGLIDGDFDAAPGKPVDTGKTMSITMTITNTGNEALTQVHVTDTTLTGPAMTELSCDFSPLGGPATGVTWDGPFEIGASFECTGQVPGMDAAAVHADEAAVTGVGVKSGTAVQDADQWHAKTPKASAPAPFDGPTTLAITGGVVGGAGLAAALLLLGLILMRRRAQA